MRAIRYQVKSEQNVQQDPIPRGATLRLLSCPQHTCCIDVVAYVAAQAAAAVTTAAVVSVAVAAAAVAVVVAVAAVDADAFGCVGVAQAVAATSGVEDHVLGFQACLAYVL